MQPPSSRVYETEIVRFHGSPRRAGAARQAEVELDNGAGQWTIGANCQVEVQVLKLDRCMMLPGSAVSRDFDGARVWIVREGRAQRRAVETGVTVEDRVQIVSGLDGHEKVVLRPSPDLVDRGRVNARVASDYGRRLVFGESVEVRLRAAMTIGQFGSLAVDLVAELINATEDRDVRVVSEAITALGMIGPTARQAIGVLDAMSLREDKQISERAKAALRLIRR